SLAPPEVRTIDEVVVHERRHMDELDRDSCGEGRLAAGRRGEEDERRTQTLASRRERLVADGRDETGMGGHAPGRALLERLEIAVDPRYRANVPQRRRH